MHFSPLVFTLLSSALAASVKPEAAYYTQAARILKENPLIDGHVDLPFVMRHLAKKPMEVIKDLSGSLPGHVDIPRMKEGGVGGVFNVAYAPCNSEPTGKDFLLPTNSAEYALESVDLINQLVAAHPEDLAMAYTAADVRANFKAGKISSLIGLEGSHHLMNSLSILRTFYSLGVRYVTLTHTCHNSFASSAGDGSDIKPVHRGNGLTALGREMIYEMNRLGMMIDLSHVSDQTMTESIKLSVAPVIFSHSGARAIHEHPRNVPDSVLELIGSGPGKNNGVVMAVFYPAFVGKEGEQNVEKVADHIEHLAKICGKAHVGLGSDFDGMHSSVEGLEDTSKFPNIVAELLGRGWTESEMVGLIGGNVLRVMDAVDDVRKDFEAKKNAPATGVYDKRKDAPVQWGGPGGSYLPDDVKLPSPVPPRDEQLLIIDLTSTIVRAGVGVHDLIRGPTVEISTRLGKRPTSGLAPKLTDYLAGRELAAAEAAGEELEDVFPMVVGRQGLEVVDWTGLEALFRHVLHFALPLPRPPLAHPVLLSLPPNLPPILYDQFHLLLFEKLLVPQLLLATRPFLAVASAGVTSGVVLDIGARGEGSEISVVFDSQEVGGATERFAVDEGCCDDWLAFLLLSEDASLPTKLGGEAGALEGIELGKALRKLVEAIKATGEIGFTSPLFEGKGAAAAPGDDSEEGVLDVAKVLAEGKVDKVVKKKGKDKVEVEEEEGDFIEVAYESETLRIGPTRHRHAEPLFMPDLLGQLKPTAQTLGWIEYENKQVEYAGVQELIGVVIETVDSVEIRRSVWEGVVIVGSAKMAGNKALGPAMLPLLSPFVIDAESGSEFQPKVLHFAKVPDYFSEFKVKSGEWGVYLGGCIMAKILISDLQSKLFMSKGDYTSKGPASYRLLEAL